MVRVGVVRGATKTAEAAMAEVATQSRTCSVGCSRDLMKVATATSAREATLHGNPLTRGLLQGRAACAHAVAQAIPQSSSSNLRPSAIDFAVLTRGHTGRSPEPIPLTRSAMARRDARLGHDKSRKRLDGSAPDAPGPRANAIESTAVEMRRSSSDAHRPSDGAYRPHRLAPPAAKALLATTRHSLSRICATGHINNGGQACSGQVVASGAAHRRAVMAVGTEEPERPAAIGACASERERARRRGRSQDKERHERAQRGWSRWSRCFRCSGRRRRLFG